MAQYRAGDARSAVLSGGAVDLAAAARAVLTLAAVEVLTAAADGGHLVRTRSRCCFRDDHGFSLMWPLQVEKRQRTPIHDAVMPEMAHLGYPQPLIRVPGRTVRRAEPPACAHGSGSSGYVDLREPRRWTGWVTTPGRLCSWWRWRR
jgi:hypothetical protein